MTKGPSTLREDHGRSRQLGIKEHVLKKGKMLWVERGLRVGWSPTTVGEVRGLDLSMQEVGGPRRFAHL